MDPSPATRTDEPWLTALLRPVGPLDRHTSARLDAALRSLTSCASMVIIDLDAARVTDRDAARMLAGAADRLAQRDGMLLLVNAQASDQAILAEARAWRSSGDPIPIVELPVPVEPRAVPAPQRRALCTVTDGPDGEIYAMPLG